METGLLHLEGDTKNNIKIVEYRGRKHLLLSPIDYAAAGADGGICAYLY